MHAVTLLSLMMACGPKAATETPSASDTAPTTDSSAPDSGEPLVTVGGTSSTPSADVDTSLARLDIHQVAGSEPQPLVVLIHGGSWVGGDKANFAQSAPDFIP